MTVTVQAYEDAPPGPMTFELYGISNAAYAGTDPVAGSVTVVQMVNLSLTGTPGSQETEPGGFLVLNDDDDNDNGTPDKNDPGATNGEDDLVALTIDADGSLSGTVELWFLSGSDKVKVYENADRSGRLTTWPQSWSVFALPKTVYLEGVEVSGWLGDVELHLEHTNGPCEDVVNLTVVDVDADVDSDNEDGTGGPDRSLGEEALEGDPPGKLVFINDDDDDSNGTPDHQQEPPPGGEDDLVALVLEALPIVGTGTWRLEYNVGLVEVYESNRSTVLPSGYLINLPMTPNPGNYWIEGLGLTQSAALTLKVDFDGDGTVDTTDSVLISVVRADLDGDGDHDGVIDDIGPDDDTEDTLPGVIVLANQDDDDSDGAVDHADAVVNLGDAGDLAPLVIRQIPGIPSNWTVRLTLQDPTNVASGIDASEVVRIFPDDAAGTAALLGPATTTFTLVEDAASHDVDLAGLRSGDVLLYVEGLEFAGEVKLVLEVVDNTATMRREDRVQLKVAPLILLGHLDAAQESYVSRIGGDPVIEAESTAYTMQRFPNATPGGIIDSIIVPPLNSDYGAQSDDPWTQDEFQIAFQEAPYAAPMYIVLDSKRDRGLKPFPPTLLGPDFGHIQIDGGDPANTHDAFGNLEVSPGIPPSLPFGRIYYGWNGNETDPLRIDDDLRGLLTRQSVQDPVFFDTDWLDVGHVDEFMTIVPNPNATHGWSVLLADTELALAILQGDELAPGGVDPNLHIAQYRDHDNVRVIPTWEVDTVDKLLGRPTDDLSTSIEQYNGPGGPVANMLAQVKAQLEDPTTFGLLASEDLYRIPALFDADRNSAKAVAISPNLVNGTVYGTMMIIPDPFLHASTEEDANANWKLDPGEDANGDGMLDTTRDPFIVWLNQNLPPGITATTIDNWLIYHLGKGEVHCSSNERRAIPSGPKWWEPAP